MVVKINTKWIPPFRWGAAGITIWPFIFIYKDIFMDKVKLERMIVHEKVHLKRQLFGLILPWYILYGVSKRFRLKEEIIAYKTEYIYSFKKFGPSAINKEYYYRSLSSDLYNNLVSYDEAKEIVSEWETEIPC